MLRHGIPQVRRPKRDRILGTARPKERLPRSRTGRLTGPNARTAASFPTRLVVLFPGSGPGQASGREERCPGERLPDRQARDGDESKGTAARPLDALAPTQLPIRAMTETTRRRKGCPEPGSARSGRTRCDEHQDVRVPAAGAFRGISPRTLGQVLRRRSVRRLDTHHRGRSSGKRRAAAIVRNAEKAPVGPAAMPAPFSLERAAFLPGRAELPERRFEGFGAIWGFAVLLSPPIDRLGMSEGRGDDGILAGGEVDILTVSSGRGPPRHGRVLRHPLLLERFKRHRLTPRLQGLERHSRLPSLPPPPPTSTGGRCPASSIAVLIRANRRRAASNSGR